MLQKLKQNFFFIISIGKRKLSPDPSGRSARNLPVSEAGFENHWAAGHLSVAPVQYGLRASQGSLQDGGDIRKRVTQAKQFFTTDSKIS
jgi:hypothetical protein